MQHRHHEGLDALRGVAAFMVLATHIGQFFPSDRPFAAGYLGVDVFFAISGVVIGLSYEGELASGRLAFMRYLAKRLARLYPTIALGVVLGLFSVLLVRAPVDRLALRFVFQLAMLPTLWLGGHLFLLNGPQWSLFFEICANAAHAAVARVLTDGRLLLATTAFAVLLAGAAGHFGVGSLGYLPETFLGGVPRMGFSFCAGLLIQRLWRAGRLPEYPRAGWLALPGIALAMVAAGYGASVYADLLVVFVASPIAVAGAAGARSRAWEAVAKAAGRLSYPVYALQLPAIGLLGHFLGRPAWFSYRRLALWIALAAGLVVVAALVDRFYDAPLQRSLRARRRTRQAMEPVLAAP